MKSINIIALALLFAGNLKAQNGASTNNKQTFTKLISVYNTGDSVAYKAFFSSLNPPAGQVQINTRRLNQEFAEIGTMKLMKVSSESPVMTKLVLKSDAFGSWWEMYWFTDSLQHFKEHHMRPVRFSGDFLQTGKLTDKQVLAGTDAYISNLLQKKVFAGNVLIARNNNIIYRKSFGNNSAGKPNTAEQQFNLASMGKLFTTISILQLIDKKQMSLADSVGKIMPELKNKALKPITIKQLLTHTSGMGDFFEDPAYQPERGKAIQRKDFVAAIEKDELRFPPGKSFGYSNTGFLLLGLMVEKVTGQSFRDYVHEKILVKAGMRHTIADSGAGGGSSTVDDIYKLSQAIRGGVLLSTAMSNLFAAYHTTDWGLGQEYQQLGHEVITGHSGGYIGVCTELNIYQKSGYTVVILSNSEPPYGSFLADKIKELVVRK